MFWHKRMIGNYYFLEAGNNEKTYFGSISTKCFLWSFFTLAAQLGEKKYTTKTSSVLWHTQLHMLAV